MRRGEVADEGAWAREGDAEPAAAEIEEGDMVRFVREIRMYDDEIGSGG